MPDLTNAILRSADVLRANLSDADLTNVKLHRSILAGVRHEPHYPLCEDADFKDAIIDDERLTIHLRDRGAKNVPASVKSKNDLKERLEKSGMSSSSVQEVLDHSKLPDGTRGVH